MLIRCESLKKRTAARTEARKAYPLTTSVQRVYCAEQ